MSQQHFNDDIKLRCEKHPQYAYCSLYLEYGQNKISRLLCTKCTANAFNNNQILQRVVPLQDFLDNSANSIKEIFQIEGQEQLNQETLQQLEDDLTILEKNISKQISDVRLNIQEIKNLNAALDIEISKNLKLDGITQDINTVKNLDIHQGTVEFKNVLEKLEILSQNLTKSYIETTKQVQVSFCQVIGEFQSNLEIISNQINKFTCDSISKLQTYNVFPMPLNIYDDLKEFPLIHKQISEGKKIEYQLIYQFSTDGLQYWQKCNNQSNLLTIMTSKNGQKFGGYSPCQIIQNKNNFIQDPSMRSFIFQYEIIKYFYTTKRKYILLRSKNMQFIVIKTMGPLLDKIVIFTLVRILNKAIRLDQERLMTPLNISSLIKIQIYLAINRLIQQNAKFTRLYTNEISNQFNLLFNQTSLIILQFILFNYNLLMQPHRSLI